MRVGKLEKAVLAHYSSLRISPELLDELRNIIDGAADATLSEQAIHRAQLEKRITELNRQEDRYLDLVLDPDWPRAKIQERLKAIKLERDKLRERLAQTEQTIDQGRINARAMLTYLESPEALYERANLDNRQRMNRMFFNKLWINVSEERGVWVAGDRVNEPFATVVYLRRADEPTFGLEQNEGGIPEPPSMLTCTSSSDRSWLSQVRVRGIWSGWRCAGSGHRNGVSRVIGMACRRSSA